jgi:hypothetical protein
VPEDLLTRLEAADPARDRRLPEDERERLLARIVEEPLSSAPARRGRRIAPRRTLVLAAILALAASGVGLATFDFGQSPDEVERDYAEVIRQVPLPPGYRWPGAVLDPDAVYAGRRAAIMQATSQASCAWWDHWLRAAARGDERTMAAALRGQARVFAMTPRAPKHGPEDVGGLDESSVAFQRELIASARAGRTGPVESYIEINCPAGLTPR